MTDLALIERITRSLAFMLRHQPETFDLELDPFGFADLDDVVHALNERLGEPVEEDDVREAVRSGDRPRYEIQEGRIRALYGHSIPVEPGPSSKPPESLYVAVPERELERARRFGLRGGRRRFLHLAITPEDAAESGRRAAQDYSILTVRALDAWEEGISFFDRIALWLAEEVPTHLLDLQGTYHDGTDPEPRFHDGPRERGQGHGGGGGHHGHGGHGGQG
ncbi:MAG: RNA 2'-phosphotransferase, partial [Planctomycetota bacterium]